jgi:hypothetical protein
MLMTVLAAAVVVFVVLLLLVMVLLFFVVVVVVVTSVPVSRCRGTLQAPKPHAVGHYISHCTALRCAAGRFDSSRLEESSTSHLTPLYSPPPAHHAHCSC